MILRTLICKRDLLNGCICLKSVVAASQEKIRLVIHEDGSLDERDVEFLFSQIPQMEIVRRRESEEAVKEKLQKHPKCLAYREQHPLSNKLLDIPLLNEATLNFIDSDILFFRRIVRIFPENLCPVFSKEDDQGYSGPLLKIISKSQNRLPSGCNTGLFRLPQTIYDLDYIEWFLSQEDLWQIAPALKEQTCFALLFGHEGCKIFSPSNLRCTHKKAVVTEATIAIHFIAGLKEKIRVLADQSSESIQSNPITTFRYLNARELTVASAIKSNAALAIKREIKRTIKKRH